MATSWKAHRLRLGTTEHNDDGPPDADELGPAAVAWIGALVQSEHLSLLIGNGLTTAISGLAGTKPPSLSKVDFGREHEDKVNVEAKATANRLGRAEPNIEDQLRAALQLIGGLRILGDSNADEWREAVDQALLSLAKSVLSAERGIATEVTGGSDEGQRAQEMLLAFLLCFASRSTTRERLHLFTTNYDRLLEFGCDIAGLRPIDRFVGALEPLFRSSRLDVDFHYNPPGIRGEPRYLEGVVRLTKLHGSLDWRFQNDALRRVGLPFGAEEDHPAAAADAYESLMVYPNPAKEIESVDFPYAELFRDFAAALCRPNSCLVTYGYGFGDEHINRVIREMLTISSTHLLVISYDDCGGMLESRIKQLGPRNQISLLVGTEVAAIEPLVEAYLPRPAAEGLLAHARDRLAAATGGTTATP